jgi:hypothetical protein
MNYRILSILICLFLLSTHILDAQDPARYREFALGSGIEAVAKLTGTTPSEAKAIHQRPVMMQNLEWRPRYSSRGASPRTDPAELIVFRFYDDQLFRVIVDYDRDKTEGMTVKDMVDAISAAYGPPVTPLPKPRQSDLGYGAPDTPLAIWGNKDYSVTLLRVAYPVSFKLIVALTRLDTLARAASVEAVRLDLLEAPQREIARQKREAEEAVAARDKAQIENKAVFRP